MELGMEKMGWDVTCFVLRGRQGAVYGVGRWARWGGEVRTMEGL
jgi:hypothetical protein